VPAYALPRILAGKRAPGIDPVILDELRTLAPNGYLEIIRQFLQSAPSKISLLRDAAVRGDREALMRGAHNLKASSGNLGAAALAGWCQDLEALAETRTEGAAAMVEAIEAEWDTVRRELERAQANGAGTGRASQ
jgi:histidine phosphotransfer protein HptB